MVRAFAHDAMGRRIDPSWWTQGARCSSMVRAFAHGAMGRQIIIKQKYVLKIPKYVLLKIKRPFLASVIL